MAKYQIGETQIDGDSESINRILESAHSQKVRPLCLCKRPYQEMYICKSGNGKFFIKRMPNTGHKHLPSCGSYEIPKELSGRGNLDPSAIREDQSGNTKLSLGFPLTKMSADRNLVGQSGSARIDVQKDADNLSLRGLLHLLYEDAELNKWHPGMWGKRNYYVVRTRLSNALEGKEARKLQLNKTVFIPESFRLEKKDEIQAKQVEFFSRFARKSGNQKLCIIIGEVKNITNARFGYQMVLKHMPNKSIYMNEQVHKRICKTFEKELTLFTEDESIHLLTICTCGPSGSGNLALENVSFMTVDSNWIPFNNLEEKALVDILLQQKRIFTKTLSFNLSDISGMANAVLTDAPEPLCLFLVEPGEDAPNNDDKPYRSVYIDLSKPVSLPK